MRTNICPVVLYFFLLFLPQTVISQSQSYYMSGKITDNAFAYAFGDNVNVREAPTVNSKSVGKLRIGTEVTVLSNGSMYELNGLQAPWYEIKAGNISGWVWGGLLSLTHGKIGNDLIMYGLTGFSPDSNFTGEVRYVKNNKLIASVYSRPIYTAWENVREYTYNVSGNLNENTGLKNLFCVFEVAFLYEACGYQNGSQYYGWNGNRFIPITEASFGSDAGIFSYNTEVIFPWDEGGEKNKVRSIYTAYDFDEDAEDYKLSDSTVTDLIWNGTDFTKAK